MINEQKELERLTMLQLLIDILSEQPLTPDCANRVVEVIESVQVTNVTEAKIVKQNLIAGYGKVRIN